MKISFLLLKWKKVMDFFSSGASIIVTEIFFQIVFFIQALSFASFLFSFWKSHWYIINIQLSSPSVVSSSMSQSSLFFLFVHFTASNGSSSRNIETNTSSVFSPLLPVQPQQKELISYSLTVVLISSCPSSKILTRIGMAMASVFNWNIVRG